MPNLVLDLDETLLKTTSYEGLTPEQKRYLTISDLGDGMATIHRPFLNEFCQFVNANFDGVYVYTAGTLDYAKDIVEVVLPGFNNLHSVWSRGYCEWSYDQANYKPLWNKYVGPCSKCSGPCFANCEKPPVSLDSPTTFFIDDRHDITHYNIYVHGRQQLVIPAFHGDIMDTQLRDLAIPTIEKWLSELK